MPDTQFSPLGTVTAPADWTLPPSLELVLKAAQATFDGTGAGGSFLPALQIVSDSGHSVGLYVADTTIAAGSSAEVSFFPFSPSAASVAPGGGIQFDTEPQDGQWLYVAVDGPGHTASGWGMQFVDNFGDGIFIDALSVGDGDVRIDGDLLKFNSFGNITLSPSSGGVFVTSDLTVSGAISVTGASDSLIQSTGGQVTLSGNTNVIIGAGASITGQATDVLLDGSTSGALIGGTPATAIGVHCQDGEFAVTYNPAGGSGAGHLLYQIVDSGDGVHFNHEWYDGPNGNVIMSVFWNGANYVYSNGAQPWV